MENRLEIEDRLLSDKILSSSTEKQRQIAEKICQFAISFSNIENELVLEAFRCIEKEQIPNKELSEKIKSYVDELDIVQWDLYDLFDEGKVSEEEAIYAFSRARAVNALQYALDEDPKIAAIESTYEAIAATDNLDELRKIILSILE